MIRYFTYFFLIYQIFYSTNAEPLQGEKVYPADFLEFPFMASLGLKHPNAFLERGHLCTGSLITKEHVLTVAHCFEKYKKSQIDVIVGDVDLTQATIKYEVDSWITYDEWARQVGKTIELPINDIAIVKLAKSVNREGITPVTITHLNNQQLYRTNAIIAGWGVGNNEVTPSDLLLKAKVKILTPEKCKHQLKLISNSRIGVQINYLCTFANPYVLSTCGDSGGPLLDENKVLLGITRSTCANKQWGNFSQEFINQYKVNLHISVNYYRDFITNVTNVQ